jgi:hypothetical protein
MTANALQPTQPKPPRHDSEDIVSLRRALLLAANPGGGWGYYAGKASRLEPTCWALLALGADPATSAHAAFLTRSQRPGGWLVEDPRWPTNVAFNALAAFTWLARTGLSTDEARRQLVTALVSSKGVQGPPLDGTTQDNSLQAWAWIDGTFSWVEPTCWGLLALKRARRIGLGAPAGEARVAEAEKLMTNRACQSGGWTFGNASMMRQDLRAYVPTTALGLLALRDRPADPVVARGLQFLEAHWEDEISATALGLSLVCLRAFGRPADALEARLRGEVEPALRFANLHGMAIALFALTFNAGRDGSDVFAI